MSEFERGRHAAGQSRSRTSGKSTSSRSRSTGSRGRTSSGRSSSSSRSTRSSTAHRSSSHSTRNSAIHNNSHNRRRNPYGYRRSSDNWWLFIVGLVVIVAVVSIVLAFRGKKTEEEPETTAEETTVPPTELEKEVMVDGVDITGMSLDAAKGAILKEYPWSMQIVYGEEIYEVANLMEQKVDQLLSEIYSGEAKRSYSLDTGGLEEAVAAEAASAAQKWDKAAKNGSIDSFDKSTNKFTFSGAENGLVVDQEKLVGDINSALKKKQFDAVITASASEVEPEFNEAAAREKYTTISTFTTNTTANSKRNTNVRLASEAINGTVLKPGEEFSFNDTVGQRTEEKGYQAAAAYSNGEVVQEIGGGVCQVSTTLYNAVLRAGLKTTVRRSHTYEPSYVTPGQDATVSYGGPDYKFVNNSNTAIGIRASYGDRVCTVSIYGIPILEEGVKYSLKSTKIKDTDVPAPTYEEDQTLQPDVEKVKSQGSQGSYWETRLVVTKDGEVVSEDVDHNTTYKGHAPVVLRNTSGVVVSPEETTAAETVVPSDGAGDGFVPPQGTVQDGSGDSPASGGGSQAETSRPSETTAARPAETTKAAETTAARPAETTAAPTTAPNAGGPGFEGPTVPQPQEPNSPAASANPDGPGVPNDTVIAPNPLTGVSAP